jgi:hypothetical protein
MMYAKLPLSPRAALLVAGLALSSPVYAQDQKPPATSPQAGQGMTMPPEMMARMNKMMDMCEKMMGDNGMHKGMMPRHKRN